MNSEDIKKKRIQLKDLSLPEDLKNLEIQQCKTLCHEVRNILVSTVSKTGGHLASNLGAVELTLALHRNFSSPDDKIIWDVGHQTYTHKILTGRMDKFSTLRQENGISGFPKPEESEHDIFISGHSSTSISVACGVAEAMKLQGKDNYTVAVIGDGAMTGGMAYEGLNNAGKSNKNLIVILNDNEMSISKNVGSLAKYLTSLRGKEKYLHTKRAVEKTLINIPVVGMPVARGIKNSKDAFRDRLLNNTQCTMFEDMGFIYLGPVDGHDIEALDEVLRTAKSYKAPVLVHVSTVKGKGYPPAEKNPGEFHGISRFDIVTGNPEVSLEN
ncbi:MAG: 1-deoxy-D-xylulose-5-phosphate synthase N-terminal domain-containing protein, partial [Ruminococcus sp.]